MMRKTLWLLMLVPLLAGCLAGDDTTDEGGDATTPVDDAPFLSVVSTVDSDAGTGEPSMGVTPDGVLFTNILSHVYRSADDGATWEDLGDVAAPVPNEDPDLAVDADGNIWESRDYIGCLEVAVSRDGGATWASNPAVCPGTGLDRQYVVPTEGGEAYVYAHQIGSQYQIAMKTTDYGTTWLPVVPPEGVGHQYFVNGGSGWGGGGFWNPATGSVWFTFNYLEGQPATLLGSVAHAGYVMTSDGGTTWTLGFAGDLDGQQLGLGLVTGAADDAGNVYLTWGEAQGDDVAIFVAGSQDDGATWSEKVRIDDRFGSDVFPMAAAGADGRVAVAFYEGDQQTFPDDMQGNWTVTLAWTDDFWGTAQWQNETFSDGVVKQGPICISGTTCTGGREFLDYFALDRMPDGRVAGVYNTLLGGELRNRFSLTTAPLLS